MREGQVAHPSPGETIRCIRSGLGGGPFVFEMSLAPRSGGPPVHTHDEGDEIVEVLEGEFIFRVNGVDRRLHPGQALTLTPSDAHTFRNPSRTHRARARVTSSSRFERLIEQPSMTALLMYLTYVDPGASRPAHLFTKLMVRAVAWSGRLRGVRPIVPPDPPLSAVRAEESPPAGEQRT